MRLQYAESGNRHEIGFIRQMLLIPAVLLNTLCSWWLVQPLIKVKAYSTSILGKNTMQYMYKRMAMIRHDTIHATPCATPSTMQHMRCNANHVTFTRYLVMIRFPERDWLAALHSAFLTLAPSRVSPPAKIQVLCLPSRGRAPD